MRHILTVLIFGLAMQVRMVGQAYSFNQDPRRSVRAFAADLARLTEIVKANPDITENDPRIRGLLSHLDFARMTQPEEFVSAFTRENAETLALQAAAQSVANYRPDKQTSPTSNAAGTTSLVSKAGASNLLSIALDAGALTRSSSGSTATVNGNVDGLVRAVTGYSPLCVYPCPSFESSGFQWVDSHVLQPINVSIATAIVQSSTTVPFTTQANGTSPPLGSANIPTGTGKVTNVTARYQILNRFDPHSTQFKKKWKAAKDAHQFPAALITANNSILGVRDIVQKTATPLSRHDIVLAAKAGDQQLSDYFYQYYEAQIQRLTPDVSAAVAQAVQNIAASQEVWEKARQEAVGTLFTLEYSFNHPMSEPETHDFRIIYGYAPQTVAGILTLNGALSIYNAVSVGARYGRLRDGQIAAEYDRPFNLKETPSLLMLSLAGYWQYQPHPSILNISAGTVAPGTNIGVPNTQEFVGTAGSLWVTQAKITVKLRSGINIPLGVKWSNKSELLTGNKIGGQVGISYDFSALSSIVGGAATK